MQQIVIALVIKWLVGDLVAAGAALNWATVKANVDTKIAALTASLHVGFLTVPLDNIAGSVVDAAAKLSQDKTDETALLTALAAKNVTAAEAALKAMLQTVATGDLAALHAAA